MSRFGYRNQREGQRGALLVLFALLLPVFFACAGLAVDLGNMYSYKSNLQNAVDAAALAGASGYTAGGDTVDYHPEADEMAAEYLKANLDNSYSSLKDKSFEAQTVSGKTYYRVKVTEPSPTYFMRMLGIKPYIDVSADAVALVGNPGTTDLHFKDLIGAREILGLDSLKNGRVNTTYDGNVVDLSSRFAGTTIYTSSALGQKENQANADGNYSAVQAGEASDYNSFYRSTTEKINEMYDAAGSSVVDWNYTNRAVSGSSDYYKKETSTLEADFFIRSMTSLIPLEVKAASGRAKSMNTLINSERYPDIRYGFKFSSQNIGHENCTYTFPYFCTYLLKRFMADFHPEEEL